MTFGQTISDARKRLSLSQRELAQRVKKEDGQPISPQYLNDLERDRRNPPSSLLEQFAAGLEIPVEVLYYEAGELPKDVRGISVDQEHIVAAYTAFRRTLKKD